MLKEGMARQQIVAVLQGYTHDINRIVTLIPHGSGAAAGAQARLKQLKTAIHNDFKHRYAIARNPELSPAEQAKLAHTIREVFAAVQAIGVNTNPSAEWRSALFAADLDITRLLSQLHGVEAAETTTSDWF
jgi:hypothetical protein